jgi:hypothetical protein
MREFIESTLNEICDNFFNEITKLDKLCDLKKIRFDGSNIPDYSNPLVRQLYLLRYFPAYLVEYYLIYKKLIEYNHLELPFNILSIGCGCGIDYYGLFFAMKEANIDFSSNVRYMGLDRIKWDYFYNMENDNCYLLHQDLANLKQFDKNNYNIIIFPKSIGEFSDQIFTNILTCFEITNFEQDRICLICSLREQRRGLDIDRFEAIARDFSDKHNYICLDENRVYYYFKNPVGLRKICPEFVYPDDMKDKVSSLLDRCPGYIDNLFEPHENDCERMLKKQPILTSRYINFQIKRFYRE